MGEQVKKGFGEPRMQTPRSQHSGAFQGSKQACSTTQESSAWRSLPSSGRFYGRAAVTIPPIISFLHVFLYKN